MIGTTLDKYQVLQKVGEGGMATVYRGRHCTLDRTVAIKVLHPHLSSSVRNRTRFAREVEAIERLRHENILEIFDYSGNDGSDCYLVTEFVDGETLTHLLERRGRLPSEVVAQVGIALSKALGYAHAQGILHRDVKTDNVMVRSDGTVKLMDFGIARFLDESRVTMTGALVGSPAFMSPEQAREGTLDQRSDLFALGTVLFYLVTGHLPFTGGNPSLILKNVIEGNRPHVAELAPTMSAALADTIERLMATAPDDRFTVASDVATHLTACLRESQIYPMGGLRAPIDPNGGLRLPPPIDPTLASAPLPRETDADPAEWSLAAWLADPDDYEKRLDDHLKRVLVEEGRRLLAIGDHLTALRLLNRLLSMDEQNTEVLSLVQGLHGEPPAAGIEKARVLAVGTLVLLGLAVGGLFVAVRWAAAEDVPPPAPLTQVEPGQTAMQGAERLAPTPNRGNGGATATAANGGAGTSDAGAILRPVVGTPSPPAPVPQMLGLRISPVDRSSDQRPAPAPAPATTAAGTADALAVVRLNTGDYVADVFLRGTGMQIGDTRHDIPLHAGTYELELRSPVLVEHVEKVTVASGERLVVPVTLRPKPSRVRFARTWPAACNVRHNGVSMGTLGALDWVLTVQRPDQQLEIALSCPDGRNEAERWRNLGAPEVTFSP